MCLQWNTWRSQNIGKDPLGEIFQGTGDYRNNDLKGKQAERGKWSRGWQGRIRKTLGEIAISKDFRNI